MNLHTPFLDALMSDARVREELWSAHMRALRARRTGAATAQRVQQLEDDVARLTLMVMTLTEAVLRKNVMTREEMAALASEIDRLDGQADGKVDPAALRPPEPPPPKLVRRPRR